MARLCSRLPWVSITPFGAAVEPEVYCRKARVVAPISGRCQLPAGSLLVSVANQSSDFISGAYADRRSSLDRMWVVVSATVAFESATIVRSRDTDPVGRTRGPVLRLQPRGNLVGQRRPGPVGPAPHNSPAFLPLPRLPERCKLAARVHGMPASTGDQPG